MLLLDRLPYRRRGQKWAAVLAVLLVVLVAFFPLSSVSAAGTFITNTDNQNNARTGVADGDMDIYVCAGDALMPIEFNIITDQVPTSEAILSIYAYDVDEEMGEIDTVYFNGQNVGRLSGTNGTWNTTVFTLPIGLVQNGSNLVEITVSSGWCTQIDWGQLLIDGGAADMASIGGMTVIGYGPSAYITPQVTVNATQTGTYRLELSLLDPSNNNLVTNSQTFSLSGGASTDLSAVLNYPASSPTGTYRIVANLFDTATNIQQDSQFITFLHTAGSGPTYDSAPTAFSAQTPPATATYGAPYAGYNFAANGTPAPTYALAPSSNPLPPGLSLAANGALTGTPTAAGTYSGIIVRATNYLGSTDTAAFTITVNRANTTTGVVRSVSSPVYGQPLYLTATVAPVAPAGFTPAGQVQFYVDGVAFGSPVNLSSGTAVSQTTTSLSAGSHTYYAAYLGNANNNASSSLPAASVTVSQNSTTTTVVSSDSTSVYGQPLQLTATVSEIAPSVVNPAGQVQFYVDGAPLGSPVSLNGAGQATSADLHTLLPGGHLLVGTHTFSASYLGNSNTLPSASGNSTQTVERAPTSVVVSSSENPTVYGTSLDMTITVTSNAPGIAVPVGTVQLSIDGVLFGTPLTLNASGQVVRTVPYLNLWPGDHTITAVYTPADPAQFLGSNNQAAPLNQRVNKANPVITITPSAASPVATQPITYSVSVQPSMVTQGIPTGQVQFYVDGAPLGSPVTLDAAGNATSPLAVELSAGTHAITVGYTGDDYFLNVPTSPALSQAVGKAGAVASIVSIAPQTSVVGQPVTVTVQVDAVAPATDVPDGTVTVSNGVDSCLVTLDASGSGSCQLAPNSPGAPNLVASYSGSTNFNEASSAPFAGPVVSKADSAVGILGFGPGEHVTGQPVTIFFSVSPVAPGWGTPTGQVTVTDAKGRTCSAPVAAGSCQITFDEAGPTSLSIAYEGDSNFNPSASAAAVAGPVVQKATTTLALATSATPSAFGQPVSFTATVAVSAPGAGSPTGMVQFTIDGVNFGEPVALSGASAASPSIANLAVGTHSLGATYLGDANFASASAPAINQVVQKAATTLVLTSNINPSPYGLSVLITATVTGNDPSLAFPTGGTVQFIVDGVNYGAPVALGADGKASKLLPYTALWVGTHSITAVYSGNASFLGSDNLSNPYLQVVEKGLLAITLLPTVDNPVFGQPVGFTATVLGSGANNPLPTGTVQFSVDGVDLGMPVTLDAAGSALSQLISSLGVGPHTVRVSYSGDDYYRPDVVDFTPGVLVAKADVTAAISGFDPATAVVGQPVAVSFNVTPVAPGSGIPGGTVTISNGVDSCTAPVAAGSCNLTPSAVGSPQLTITYSGDTSFNAPATTPAVDGPAVTPASVTVTITGTSPDPVVVGQHYTVTAQVTPDAPSTLIPVGMTVTLSNGSDSCVATVQADGSAACNLTPSSTAPQTLTASFEGGANYNDAVSAPASGPTVNPADTATTLTTSINPAVEGAGVTFSASVLATAPGGGTPAGQVQFKIDGANFGGPVDLVNGVATSPAATGMSIGTHAITAAYLGNANYNASTSAAFSQKVVSGSLSAVITPGAGGVLTYTGMQNGLPVTTTITVPAGAVSSDVTLVFHQFYNSALTPPAGKGFVANFTLDAYINGELQPSLTFLQPVTFTMSYNPTNWKESDMAVYAWDGSQWGTGGIVVTARDAQADTITFTLSGTGPDEFTLACQPQFILWFPIVGR